MHAKKGETNQNNPSPFQVREETAIPMIRGEEGKEVVVLLYYKQEVGSPSQQLVAEQQKQEKRLDKLG